LPFVTVLASQQPRQALRAQAAQVKRMLGVRLRRARQNQFTVCANSKLGMNLKLKNCLVWV